MAWHGMAWHGNHPSRQAAPLQLCLHQAPALLQARLLNPPTMALPQKALPQSTGKIGVSNTSIHPAWVGSQLRSAGVLPAGVRSRKGCADSHSRQGRAARRRPPPKPDGAALPGVLCMNTGLQYCRADRRLRLQLSVLLGPVVSQPALADDHPSCMVVQRPLSSQTRNCKCAGKQQGDAAQLRQQQHSLGHGQQLHPGKYGENRCEGVLLQCTRT